MFLQIKKGQALLPICLLMVTWPTAVSQFLGARLQSHLLNLIPAAFLNNSYSLPVSTILKDGDIYDHIVVGGGAAGCAVAARLALANEKVLLIEAGRDPNLLSRIPATSMLLMGSLLDWQYETVPNNVSCLSSLGKQCRFSRGKCLGGSTSINHMLYARGNRQDYDDYNIPGWSWEDLKPYFLRYEGLQVLDQLPASSKPYHNTQGIMKLEFFNDPKNPWQKRIVKGFKSMGFEINADVNGESQIGITRLPGYVYNGERMDTARAYLGEKTVKQRLKVAKSTYCTGVLFNDKKEAIGVTVVQGARTKRIYARKEVTLSAGSIETPKILMLSGVGPADHLKEMGIPVIANLPVGENMSDHVVCPLIFLVDGKEMPLKDVTKLFEQVGNAAEFLVSRDGPLASNGLVDINLFVNTSCYSIDSKKLETGPGCELPTTQIIHAFVNKYIATITKPLFQHIFHMDDNVIDQIAYINSKYALMLLNPIVLKPLSRGNIKLASADPLGHPKIFPNYFGDDRDVQEVLRAISIIEALVESPVFKKYNAKLFHLNLPDCPSYEENKDEYWRCYIRHMATSGFHAMGTCSLQTCVDDKLRVRGVKRLGVVDASIFPEVFRGSPAAAIIAAAERKFDFIMEEPKTERHST